MPDIETVDAEPAHIEPEPEPTVDAKSVPDRPLTDREIFLRDGHAIISAGMLDATRAAASNRMTAVVAAIEATLRSLLSHLGAE